MRKMIARVSSSAVLVAALLLTGCAGSNIQPVRAQGTVTVPDAVDHSALTQLLQTYVDEQGMVDYAGLQADRDSVLAPYLQMLAETDPSNLDEPERLAFWINAYNALTLKLVIAEYPVDSIKDITPYPGPMVPKINSPWLVKVGEVGGTMRTLDAIEHDIIRERFDEPRIHFALVCAAMSCPKLRQEAFTGAALDRQLDDQGRTFLHHAAKNEIPPTDDEIRLSRIFKWFEGDFGPDTDAVQRYLARYFEGDTAQQLQAAAYDVEYLDYDWTLNDQAIADGRPQQAAASSSQR